MDLRSKLNLYKEGVQSAVQVAKKSADYDISALPPGKAVANENGSCYVIENKYPLSHMHGGCCLEEAAAVDADTLCRIGGAEFKEISQDKLLYLDTETTGLSGGAGTVAFLIGVGFFYNDTFVVRQYFMRDYDEEAAMLFELKQLFTHFDGFVTFNGKAFDINLIDSRYISNRIRAAFREAPNLDLLYPSRTIWKLKLESCRLSSLEENTLGIFRNDDIPGAMIPAVYFKYLEDRDTAEIKRVIRHNELDILSMVSLEIKLSKLLNAPLTEADGEYELLGLGRLFEAEGDTEQMLECLESCAGSGEYSIKAQAVKRLTAVYKRNGSYNLALSHWKAMEEENSGFELFHLIEMAKYYEHKAKDIAFAAVLVDRAIQRCMDAGFTGTRQYNELIRRRDRLRLKAERLEARKQDRA